MVPDALDQLESSIKLSKIPEGFVSFDNIENLRCRELAYTAHIASRANMQNEKLWERISNTFVQSIDHMTPKYLTQTLVAIMRNNVTLDPMSVSRITSAISRRIGEYKMNELILVINNLEIPSNKTGKFLDAISISLDDSIVSSKSVALLCSGLGKRGWYDNRITGKLVDFFADMRIQDEIESAIIVRYLSKCESSVNAVTGLIMNNPIVLSPSSLNILLRSVFDLSKTQTVGKDLIDFLILERLSGTSFSASSDNPDLIPHLFFYASGLVTDEQQLAVALRLASRVARNYGDFKAVAIPLVVEGLSILSRNFPDNKNVLVLLDQLTPISDSVVEKFILVAPREERVRTLNSSYSTYCPTLRDRLEASIETEDKRGNAELVRDSSMEECLAKILAEIRQGKRHVSVEAVEKGLMESDRSFTMTFYSLFFRVVSARRDLVSKNVVDIVGAEFMKVLETAPVKTVMRFMQLGNRSEVIQCFESVSSRISQVDQSDLLTFLTLVEKFGLSFENSLFFDEVESKISSSLSLMKSVHSREDLVALAKRVGLSDPEDVIDGYERELCLANKKSR